jgi:hypothetical protein
VDGGPAPVRGPGLNAVAPSAGDSHVKLTAIVEHRFRTQIAGQTEGSQAPKRYHLTCLLYVYPRLYWHDDARQWYTSVTEAFMKELARRHVPRPSKRCGTA